MLGAYYETFGHELRDAAAELLSQSGVIRCFRTIPTFQWQPEDEPGCGVYLLRETYTPDGDFNAGEPSFVVSCVIGISILTREDHPGLLAQSVDGTVVQLMRLLLRTPEFLALFEGVESIIRTPSFPTNASSYMCETRLEVTVQYRSIWPPIVPDDYLRTILTTRQPGADPASPAITTPIDIAQN